RNSSSANSLPPLPTPTSPIHSGPDFSFAPSLLLKPLFAQTNLPRRVPRARESHANLIPISCLLHRQVLRLRLCQPRINPHRVLSPAKTRHAHSQLDRK